MTVEKLSDIYKNLRPTDAVTIRGITISETVPVHGQVMIYDAGTHSYIPGDIVALSNKMIWSNLTDTDVVAESNHGYRIDTTNNAIELLLNPNPVIGDRIGIRVVINTNSFQISGNGKKIEGQIENIIIDTTDTYILSYAGENLGWIITWDVGTDDISLTVNQYATNGSYNNLRDLPDLSFYALANHTHDYSLIYSGINHNHNNVYLPVGYLDADITLTADSDTKIATQKAVKAAIAKSVIDGRGTTINNQTDNYTLQLTDAGKTIRMNKETTNSLFIPISTSVDFPIGTMISVIQVGNGITSIVSNTGVSLNEILNGSGSIQNKKQGITLIKVDTDNWDIIGSIGTIS